ncbi:MAG: MFS transporter [Desulfuromonadales bacterium]
MSDAKKQAWFGWCMYDWANSAFATVVLAAVLPVYFATLVPEGGAHLNILGWRRTVPAAALWGYAVSASMIIVAVFAPYLGALADRRKSRRLMLMLFCLIGVGATGLLFFAGPGHYLVAAGLFVVANVGFATSNVFYNAFLPALARGEEMDRLSARGFAFGYIGGGLMLLLAFTIIQWHPVFGFPDKGLATRAAFVLTALWWGLFAIPTFRLVKEEAFVHSPARMPQKGLLDYLRTLADIVRYPQLLLFLIAFLFYNDGIQTIIVVSAIFGKTELGLSQTTVLACFLVIQFVAMPGALLFGFLAERWNAKGALTLSLLIFTGITVYAYYMREAWEFWVLAILVAIVLGGSQALSRSLFASLVPQGKEAEFFGFYSISYRFASILGPLVFALITDLTGSARLSILALAGFFIIGMGLLAKVDVARGRAEARTG